MEAKINLLITRELSEEQLAYARKLGINPIMRSAIQVDFDPIEKADRHWASNDASPWVFTSKNGVEGFQRLKGLKGASGVGNEMDPDPSGKGGTLPVVYAVGKKTADALAELGLNARIPGEENGRGLASLIINDFTRENQNQTVTHWCGNRSRKELGQLLKNEGIELIRRVVYNTSLNRIEMPDETVDGILFFSPSAVEAFRYSGGFSRPLPPLFAVGHTTAQALSLESGSTIHVPERPATENLLELAANVLKSA